MTQKNIEITQQIPLHSELGQLTQPGWAKKPYWQYERKKIAKPWYRIKEWDYYCILNQEFGLALVVADLGYVGMLSAALFDFKNAQVIQKDHLQPFTRGHWKLPSSSETGGLKVQSKEIKYQFSNEGTQRILNFVYPHFHNKQALSGEVILKARPQMDSLAIAIPFSENPAYFYYNRKINCLTAEGNFSLGSTQYRFAPESALACLDWGRGVWSYQNTWYWSSLSTQIDDQFLGLNLGYGFGNTSAATENAVIYQDRLHKLGTVHFEIPSDSFLKTWKIRDSHNCLDLRFEPILDRTAETHLLIIATNQHQVFGRFFGKIVAGDKTLELNGQIGFGEKVMNRW